MVLPSLFVSHGSPELPLLQGSVVEFLKGLGDKIPRPQAIVAISAHWGSAFPLVTANPHPSTIHDFGGFPDALYRLQYPAPGDPQLAARIVKLLQDEGIRAELDPTRGLDHGTWTPLLLVYPQAEIPVIQVSLQPHLGTAHHLALGSALQSLRHEGILVLASGGATHNLRAFGSYPYDADPPLWVSQFQDWMTQAVTEGRVDDLLHYRDLAPHAARNHPTEEHLLPLFVAMGAGGSVGQLIHQSTTYGVFSMAAYAFG